MQDYPWLADPRVIGSPQRRLQWSVSMVIGQGNCLERSVRRHLQRARQMDRLQTGTPRWGLMYTNGVYFLSTWAVRGSRGEGNETRAPKAAKMEFGSVEIERGAHPTDVVK